MTSPFDLLWFFFILSSLQPLVQQRVLAARRAIALRTLERRRNSRVITMIHRQETLSILGIPFGGYIDIDDSEAVIRAIELTDEKLPIDLVLHTPGGLVLAAEQIAAALADHPGRVTVFVPHYAMSGGTLIALAADQIVMSTSAVLGPIDPQLGEYAAASILAAVDAKPVAELEDKTLILADLSRKAQFQVRAFATGLLQRRLPLERAQELAGILSEGRWTHDFPIDIRLARTLDLPVSTALPDEVRALMTLYPQPRGRRPSVEYVPFPYHAPDSSGGRRGPFRRRR
jgi:ClpP class serine protease